ncbi:four-carbon acid sugar kinase family protein [Anaeromicropila populeti]|uniref:Uncharacterized conserved protein YgbK, DUF1537 family n=1 Tax=Anaeromicropila populeti TaxID=37658 RepID=A0A1I6K907_9FIRM|nr:four-carbon acid sugar kinase family protein [Anaeromicropila populeti]SFR87702.1 Uncharacterized conserved protein YgbK, DUF1537 family [Anaeromicropila populeti]
MNEKKICADILKQFPEVNPVVVDTALAEEVKKSKKKIIVLDDDPTGVQTIHDISVYTDWSKESIRKGFMEKSKMFFILTNSRGFTVEQTTKAHIEIAETIDETAGEFQQEYMIVSRGDSTLRGHYPLETQLIRDVIAQRKGWGVDGEILCPYFKEGGRFTAGNVHYVKYGEELVPAGQTEFAKDETFGYHSNNLCEYVEEKTGGEYKVEDCICISLESLRAMDFDGIEKQLLEVRDFKKIIVNAIDNYDVKVFCTALYRAMAKGRHFMIRCAAALVKAIADISDKPLLCREEMVTIRNQAGGVIVVGSHTKKTTSQLEELKKLDKIEFIEMNSDLVLEPGELEKEVERILVREEELISQGKSVCIFTKRALLTVEEDTPEEALLRSVRISDAVQSCVGRLKVTPAFVVAKGGITSSDVGTKALKVRCAKVLGQVQPGIPVWQTGEESLFPGTPYVIFPGNVGEVDTLRKVVETLLV